MDPVLIAALALLAAALALLGALLVTVLGALGVAVLAVTHARPGAPVSIVVNPEEVVEFVRPETGGQEPGDDAGGGPEPDWRGDRFPQN